MLAVLLCVALGAMQARAATTQLARHGVLGVVPADQHGAVVVIAVRPASAAQQVGLKSGDAIVSLNAKPIASSADLVARLHLPAGSRVTLGVRRNGKTIVRHVILKAAAKETSPDFDIRYDAVAVEGTLRRTLITVPRTHGKHGAVLFIGGIGCYSIDNTPGDDPYRRLAYDLTRHGFVTMRLEKSGIGDSQGPPCATVDFTSEALSYARALASLRQVPQVDLSRVYLFGHSIGTVIAPRIGIKSPVAGIIAAEGVAINWFEYELINQRRQLPLAGVAPADVEPAMQRKEYCMHRLLIDKVAAARILRDRPACAADLAYPVPDAYVRELAALNLADPWLRVATPTLAIYGTADFETDVEDHERIVRLVNARHPGHAMLKIIPQMDHYLTHADSQQISFQRVLKNQAGAYDEDFSRAILQWLAAIKRSA